jgi:alpha,alpha-trehalase
MPGDRPEPSPSIYDYGVIGNLHTAALVRRTGSIDWACLPRFSAPSVFARLLDRTRGGYFEVRPVEPASGSQRYRPSSNVLETVFELPRARALTVTDFMPVAPRGDDRRSSTIVRILEATGGPVDVAVTLEPRFDYGSARPKLAAAPRGGVASHGAERLSLRTDRSVEPVEERFAFELAVAPERPRFLEVAWGAMPPPTPSVPALLRSTLGYWQRWVHDASAPLHRVAEAWHIPVERSELVLKLLSHVDTGAFVAAPTTSLPEWPGGSRNWDYRYVWIRDAAFSAQAMMLLGHTGEARSFLRWVVKRIDEARATGGGLRVLYGAHGETDLAERTLPDLEGYDGSRPVRVGNAAADQLQLDIYGELLDAALFLGRLDPGFLTRRLPDLLSIADAVASTWTLEDRGIWEVRGPPRHFVYSKVMTWVALDRAIRLVGECRLDDPRVPRWQKVAEEVRAAVLDRGWDAERQQFRQAFELDGADAANLRIPLVGFLPYGDPRVLGTIDGVIEELGEGPFVRRYRRPDGIDEPEGTFLPCSFWLVEALARSGRTREARERFEALLAAASPLGLYPEEYDPERGLPLGNYPQALTHVAMLRAAVALGLEDATRRDRAAVAEVVGPPVGSAPGAL